MSGDRIGERLEWLQDIIERSKNQPEVLDDKETDFINQLEERVLQYDEDTFVSLAQINWLNAIDGRLSR